MNLTPEIIDEEGKGIIFARVASKLLHEGKVDQATLISEVGIKKFPYYAQGHFILGKCYQEKDMYEEARAEYERVLRFDSAHLGAMKELAGLYNSTGLNDVYKDFLYKLLTQDPLNSNILEECREQGVYEIWESQRSKAPAIQSDSTDEKDLTELNLEEETKIAEKESEREKKDTEDLLKIDLTQFENQDDDFTTIMDGLIQETSDESEDVDASNYLKDLESPVEVESELLAEEKPIEESIDELDAFEKDGFQDDAKSTYLELDYGKKSEEAKEQQDEKDELTLPEEDTLSLQDEIDKEPEDVENAFSEPKQRVEDLEVKDESQPSNAHEKTELIFEDSDETEDNVELQFEDETEDKESEEIKIEQESEIKKELEAETETETLKEPDTETELKLDPKLDAEEEIISEDELIIDSKPDQIPDAEDNTLTEEELIPEPKQDSEIELNEKSDLETDIAPETEEASEQDEKSPYVKQKIVSQTLGEILVSQNKYKEAKQVFLALKEQQPDNPNIDKKLEILDKIIALDEKKE